MAVIYIDDAPFEVDESQNLLQVGLSLGLDIPYFCWHPAMGSVGACRQCAVQQFRDEADRQGRVVMACMTPAADGTRISIDHPQAREFRSRVIEWLMANHPHDCPVCDEGGECHLQDMTVMTGHTYRRYRFAKRTYRNQYLGPFINHEMNRCIQCYRCVRYYRDYAGGRDLDAFASRDHVYFGRFEEGTLQSEFSGNLVEVCPTGVFTDKTLKEHYTRLWDLQTAPSICVHCGLGCNTLPGERYGVLRRIRNRYNGEVNGYFLCDRGRYGYEFVNSDRRIRRPLLRRSSDGEPEPVSTETALQHLSGLLQDGSRTIGIGSPRASLEANFALRSLVGPDRFYQGMSTRESRLVSTVVKLLREGPARSATLSEANKADAVLVLGEDLTHTAPMLALAVRQSARQSPMQIADSLGIPRWDDAAVRGAVQDRRGPVFIAAYSCTGLDDVATETFRGAPCDLARLSFAVAALLGAEGPSVEDLPDGVRDLARGIAQALREAERPLVISGTSAGSEAILRGAAAVAGALCAANRQASLAYALPECNSLGLGLLGGGELDTALESVVAGEVDTLFILENDLYRRAAADRVDAALAAARNVIAIDHLSHATTARAHLTLPAATFAEANGTLVNSEGRAQRSYQVFVPAGEVQDSWRWLRDAMVSAGRSQLEAWDNVDDVTSAMAAQIPALDLVTAVAPPAELRLVGQKVPRQTHRYSGRTAMAAHLDVHEPKPPQSPDSPLSFSMEGYGGRPPSALISSFTSPGWNSVQAVNRFQSEVGGPLHGGDPGTRLLEPNRNGEAPSFSDVPEAFAPRDGSWLLLPLFHIFGSEELSLHSEGVAERSPAPYLALNPQDAARLAAREGADVVVDLNGTPRRLPVKLISELPIGTAGLPQGLPELVGLDLPAWQRIRKA